jgi:hypothetical protein
MNAPVSTERFDQCRSVVAIADSGRRKNAAPENPRGVLPQ